MSPLSVKIALRHHDTAKTLKGLKVRYSPSNEGDPLTHAFVRMCSHSTSALLCTLSYGSNTALSSDLTSPELTLMYRRLMTFSRVCAHCWSTRTRTPSGSPRRSPRFRTPWSTSTLHPFLPSAIWCFKNKLQLKIDLLMFEKNHSGQFQKREITFRVKLQNKIDYKTTQGCDSQHEPWDYFKISKVAVLSQGLA